MRTLVAGAVQWPNATLGDGADLTGWLNSMGVPPEQLGHSAADATQATLAFLGSSLASIFRLFNMALFAFYFSADGARLQPWLAYRLKDRDLGRVPTAGTEET